MKIDAPAGITVKSSSIAALLTSLFGLALLLWIGAHDIVATVEARFIARAIEFFLLLFGLQMSVVVKPAGVSISCSVVTLAFAFLSVFCFRCVVRELALRCGGRTPTICRSERRRWPLLLSR